jgi:hypothetical protein
VVSWRVPAANDGAAASGPSHCGARQRGDLLAARTGEIPARGGEAACGTAARAVRSHSAPAGASAGGEPPTSSAAKPSPAGAPAVPGDSQRVRFVSSAAGNDRAPPCADSDSMAGAALLQASAPRPHMRGERRAAGVPPLPRHQATEAARNRTGAESRWRGHKASEPSFWAEAREEHGASMTRAEHGKSGARTRSMRAKRDVDCTPHARCSERACVHGKARSSGRPGKRGRSVVRLELRSARERVGDASALAPCCCANKQARRDVPAQSCA